MEIYENKHSKEEIQNKLSHSNHNRRRKEKQGLKKGISLICGGSLLGGASGHTDAENKIIDRMNKASLMPHEFLFLLCNVSDRVACIT